MAFSLNLLEKRGWIEGNFANICILKAILRKTKARNGLFIGAFSRFDALNLKRPGEGPVFHSLRKNYFGTLAK